MLDFIWIQTYKTLNQVVYHPKSNSKKRKNSYNIPLDYQLINEESPCPTEELIWQMQFKYTYTLHMDEICSLQSRCNFDERALSIFLTKIMAAIFDFNGSGRLVRERNLYQGGSPQSKIRRGVGVGQWKITSPWPSPTPYFHFPL